MNRYLRMATAEDVDLLFEWANDSLVRMNSFSTASISYEEHTEWFKRLLHSNDRLQYIYMESNKPIGQVRITIREEEAEIGYSICKEMRGRGCGTQLLKAIKELVQDEFPQVKRIVGQVKPENIASQRAFLGAGYEEKCYVYEIVTGSI